MILKETKLLLEFWDEAIEYDIYIRNHINIGPDTNEIDQSPIKVFINTIPDIEIYKVWGSKCYVYINPKIILRG